MFKTFKLNKIGYLKCYINLNTNTTSILDLYIRKKYRHKGYGTQLINKCINYNRKLKIKKIELDDMSDIHGNNNIYYKLGFKYKYGYKKGPEMVLKLK